MGNVQPMDYPREQLPEQVAAYVRELILTGSVQAGEFLRLEPIAEALQVSTTPVREGLLTLRSEGFLRLLPRRGFVVEAFSDEDVRDLYWTQALIAGELAARAAVRITPEQLRHVEDAVAAMNAAMATQDGRAIAKHSHDFHRHVNIAAASRRLAGLAGSIASHLPIRMYAETEALPSEKEHEIILDALRRRDAENARRLMAEHVREGGERLINVLSQRRSQPRASSVV